MYVFFLYKLFSIYPQFLLESQNVTEGMVAMNWGFTLCRLKCPEFEATFLKFNLMKCHHNAYSCSCNIFDKTRFKILMLHLNSRSMTSLWPRQCLKIKPANLHYPSNQSKIKSAFSNIFVFKNLVALIVTKLYLKTNWDSVKYPL